MAPAQSKKPPRSARSELLEYYEARIRKHLIKKYTRVLLPRCNALPSLMLTTRPHPSKPLRGPLLQLKAIFFALTGEFEAERTDLLLRGGRLLIPASRSS